MFDFDIAAMIIRLPVILMALTFHEFAHAWAAYKRGDDTAYQMGRLSLNPIVHLDILGTIMLLFGPIGWAKPVPVNFNRLKNPKKDMILVAGAGPAMNLLLATVFGFALKLLIMTGGMASVPEGLITFLALSIYINIALAFFNLIPLYPLDGSRILSGFLPPSMAADYEKLNRIGPILFIGLILFARPILGAFIFGAGGLYLKLIGLGDISRLLFGG